MKNDAYTHRQPATREMLLEVFRDGYRIALEYDPESEPHIPIEPETTVSELTRAFDWVKPKALGPALGRDFGVEASSNEWLAILTPAKERTLDDICDFLVARGARLPVSKPLRIFGTECDTAGAFMSIRSIIAEEGVDVSGLLPSTDLASFVKKGKKLGAVLLAMNRLAPGVLPEPLARHQKPGLRSIVSWLFLGGLLALLFAPLTAGASWVSEWLGGPPVPEILPTVLLISAVSLTGVAVAGLIFIEWKWPTEHIARPGLETFGDLARAVAAYRSPASSA